MSFTDLNDVSATCLAAADYLQRYGLYRDGFWPGGDYVPGAPVCLYGAIAVATGLTAMIYDEHSEIGLNVVMNDERCPASRAVLAEIQARHGGYHSIPEYSDETATGVDEVVDLLRDVAAKHQPDEFRGGPR